METMFLNNQYVVCKELALKEPIDVPLLVTLDTTTGKLVPATDATNYLGVALPQYGMVPGSYKLQPVAEETDLIIKGVVKCAVTGDVEKGTPLTLDTANPGKLTVQTDPTTQPLIAIALSAPDSKGLARILLL